MTLKLRLEIWDIHQAIRVRGMWTKGIREQTTVPSLGELQGPQCHWSVGHKLGKREVRSETGEVRKTRWRRASHARTSTYLPSLDCLKLSCVWTPIRKNWTMYSPNTYIYIYINSQVTQIDYWANVLDTLQNICENIKGEKEKSYKQSVTPFPHAHHSSQHPMECELLTINIILAHNEETWWSFKQGVMVMKWGVDWWDQPSSRELSQEPGAAWGMLRAGDVPRLWNWRDRNREEAARCIWVISKLVSACLAQWMTVPSLRWWAWEEEQVRGGLGWEGH